MKNQILSIVEEVNSEPNSRFVPDIKVHYLIGTSDSDSGTVTFLLINTGNPDEDGTQRFDLEMSAESGDGNWGIKATREAINIAFDDFEEHHKKFGKVTWNNLSDVPR